MTLRLLAILCAAFVLPPAQAQTVKISGDDYWIQNAGRPWNFARLSANSYRFELRTGDRWQHEGGGSKVDRTELSGSKVYPDNELITIEYDFVLEPGPPNRATWTVIGQWHSKDIFGRPAPMSIGLGEAAEKMQVIMRSGPTGTFHLLYEDPDNLQRGRVYRMKIESRFGERGILRVTRDGVRLAEYSGQLGYGSGAYWKFGVYRSEAKGTLAATYTGMTLTVGEPSARDSRSESHRSRSFEKNS
jgi:hypothetical protein